MRLIYLKTYTIKTIRYFAALLMLISGIWHVVLYLTVPEYNNIWALVFGIIYVVTGLLLFMPKKIGAYMGLIFSLIALASAVVQKLDMKNLDLHMTVLLLIDIVVVICCAYLILVRKKSN